MSFIRYKPHSLDGNNEEIGEEIQVHWFFLSLIFNYQFWQCLWNRWILILTFPKQQTATEGVLKNCSKKIVFAKVAL